MTKKFFSILGGVYIAFCSLYSFLYSDIISNPQNAPQNAPSTAVQQPWFTGPLIVPPPLVTSAGSIETQFFIPVIVNTGIYNSDWKQQPQSKLISFVPEFFFYFGLTDYMDLQVVPEAVYSFKQGRSSLHFGDLQVGLDFQVLPPSKNPGIPSVKFSLIETFPTGKYQKLDPDKKMTDISGTGSFISTAGLVLYKMWQIKGIHYLTATFSFDYGIPSAVDVKGFNAYGGGAKTKGRVYPGNISTTILSFEYSLSQNWALAIDNLYVHKDKNRFLGKSSVGPDNSKKKVGNPSSEQISFAPGIEYSFSESLGIIIGTWVSGFGRNSIAFRAAAINIDWTF